MNRPISSRRGPVVARLSTLALLAGLFVLPVLAGCPGSLGAGPWPDPTGTGTGGMGGGSSGTGGAAACPDIPMQLATSCGTAACHGDGAPFGVFTGDVAKVWIGKPASAFSQSCNGQTMFVNAAKPAAGVLFERLTTTTCGIGGQMPPTDGTNKNPLPPANFVDCLKTWLEPQLN